VHGRRVLEHHHGGRCTRAPRSPRWVGEQAALVLGIDPPPRYHARTVARADLRLVGVDQRVERRRVHQPLLDEQGPERLDARLHVGEVGAGRVVVIVVVMVVVVMIVLALAYGASDAGAGMVPR